MIIPQKTEPGKRIFFAVSFDERQKQQLDNWRDQNLPTLVKPVPYLNFHMTLRYIGQCQLESIDKLMTLANTITTPSMSLTINRLGHFKKPKVLYLGLSDIPEALQLLAAKINALTDQVMMNKVLSNHAVNNENSGSQAHTEYKFTPHITLARKVTRPVYLQQPFAIPMIVKRFALFESVSTPAGVVYTELKCWRLR
ncbi:RNA 2',3'-cyclic phosphodiesterase [Thalassotalea litorea]|uniref:RNA 2',3'-cyclic phosphodiesterase n=1 Tax=Thalassotalea litorea TaxID=2020715 RepID=A0A5R9IG54_9GAMM|nr:RNA 2',3'-cyclic phosphodiesterase [Thalassotalea litorea]TLU64262.1 RNA 2',3'-cyclic phosphodiesterase [Thalassotalea litorea]